MAEEASGSNDTNNVTNQLQALSVTSNTTPEESIYTNYFMKIDWMDNLQAFQNLEMQAQALIDAKMTKEEKEKQKVSFVYLLLDGTILRDMPVKQSTADQKLRRWTIFVKSVFYIGSGSSDNVPYGHLQSAVLLDSTYTTNARIDKIWNKNFGVVILKVFRFISKDLAKYYVKAMKDASDIANLVRSSTGIVQGQNTTEQRKLGVYLLFKAMVNYLDGKALVPLERKDI